VCEKEGATKEGTLETREIEEERAEKERIKTEREWEWRHEREWKCEDLMRNGKF